MRPFPFRATISVKWRDPRTNKERIWKDRLGVEGYEKTVRWEVINIDAKRTKRKLLAYVIRLAILRHFKKWKRRVNRKNVNLFSKVVARAFRDLGNGLEINNEYRYRVLRKSQIDVKCFYF